MDAVKPYKATHFGQADGVVGAVSRYTHTHFFMCHLLTTFHCYICDIKKYRLQKYRSLYFKKKKVSLKGYPYHILTKIKTPTNRIDTSFVGIFYIKWITSHIDVSALIHRFLHSISCIL